MSVGFTKTQSQTKMNIGSGGSALFECPPTKINPHKFNKKS